MRGVGREALRLLEAALQAVKGCVEHRNEAGNFIGGRRHGQTLVQALQRNACGGLTNGLDRRERLAGNPARAQKNDDENGRDRREHAVHDVPAHLIDFSQVRANA